MGGWTDAEHRVKQRFLKRVASYLWGDTEKTDPSVVFRKSQDDHERLQASLRPACPAYNSHSALELHCLFCSLGCLFFTGLPPPLPGFSPSRQSLSVTSPGFVFVGLHSAEPD
jgi:hypothetical protein